MQVYRNPVYKPLEPAGVTPKSEIRDGNLSVGAQHSQEYPKTKTSGIKIRGTGAATKGVMARGPMG